MRTAIVALALPLLALAACKVTKDDQNDSITAEFNQDVAENGLEDVGNLAENVTEDIANDVEQAAEKVENEAEGVQAEEADGNSAN